MYVLVWALEAGSRSDALELSDQTWPLAILQDALENGVPPQAVGADIKPPTQAQTKDLFSPKFCLCDSGFSLLPGILVFHVSWAPSNAE